MYRLAILLIALFSFAACSGTDSTQNNGNAAACQEFRECRQEVCSWAAGPTGYYHSDASCFEASSGRALVTWCKTERDDANDETAQACRDRASSCIDLCD